MIKHHKSYKYAQSVIKGEISAPKYVIKQCENFINICNGKSEEYFVDEEKLSKIDNILKLLVMPRGLKTGQIFMIVRAGINGLFMRLCAWFIEKIQAKESMKQ